MSGNVGQADYAAANGFLDAFSTFRAALVAQGQRSGRTLAIDWPLWEEGGMRLEAEGVPCAPVLTRDQVMAHPQVLASKMLLESEHPVVGRILGKTEDTGKLLGVEKDWMVKAIKATGNYGEIFERNVGPKSALALPRGVNNLWNKGGLMYAYPIR
mgnify:CR=1 FL=1